MTIWMIFSAFLWTLFCCAECCTEKSRKVIYIFTIVIFSLFSVLRFDVGWDYVAYWLLQVPDTNSLYDIFFRKYSEHPDFALFGRFEIFFRLLYWLSDLINWRPLLFIVSGLLTYNLIFSTIRRFTSDHFLAFWIYLAFNYLLSLDTIRQALAGAVVFYSLNFIYDKKKLLFVLTICIAGLCHSSALLFLVLYPLYHYCSLKACLIGAPALICFGGLLKKSLLAYPQYEYYRTLEMPGGFYMQFVNVALCIFAFVLTKKYSREEENNARLLKFLLLGIVFPFIFGGHLGVRITSYFSIFQIIIFANTLNNLFANKKILRPCFAFLCACYFLFSIYYSSRNKQKSPYTPYRCVIFTDTQQWKPGTFDGKYPGK